MGSGILLLLKNYVSFIYFSRFLDLKPLVKGVDYSYGLLIYFIMVYILYDTIASN